MSNPVPQSASAPRVGRTASLLLLHEDDNVLVVIVPIKEGDVLEIDGDAIIAQGHVPAGHKVARVDLATGSKVLKYGVQIGSVTQDAKRGTHLHTHNIRSDYIPSHSRGETGP